MKLIAIFLITFLGVINAHAIPVEQFLEPESELYKTAVLHLGKRNVDDTLANAKELVSAIMSQDRKRRDASLTQLANNALTMATEYALNNANTNLDPAMKSMLANGIVQMANRAFLREF